MKKKKQAGGEAKVTKKSQAEEVKSGKRTIALRGQNTHCLLYLLDDSVLCIDLASHLLLTLLFSLVI